jgi:hypothetical protein
MPVTPAGGQNRRKRCPEMVKTEGEIGSSRPRGLVLEGHIAGDMAGVPLDVGVGEEEVRVIAEL